MNARVLRTELKRSAAPWAGLAVLGGALAFLYLIDGPWWRGTAGWTAQWTSMALWTRTLLAYLWPVAVGIGALQGLRDSRSGMTELLTTTPRPAWRRAALPASATALTLVGGFGLLVLCGGAQVALGTTTYTHLGWLPISLVGALALVAGALFGMGTARALPSVLTPPVLALLALVAGVLLRQNVDGRLPSGMAPNQLSLLSPVTAEARDSVLTLAGSVHVGQTLWLLGLLGTGFALLVAATARARLLAVAPVVAGAVLALLVLPTAPRDTYVTDKAAATLVCEGPVCVTEAHEDRLSALAPRGEKALRLLRAALGDKAPDTVREESAPRGIMEERDLSEGVLMVDFDDPVIARARGTELTRALLGEGLAPHCAGRSDSESGGLDELAAQSVAASWALGERDLTLLEGAVFGERDHRAAAEPVWKKLTALSPAEQRARVAAAHAAALSCSREQLETLEGSTSS
ncbi:hypothetical protein [Streptomyces daliensis]|uniref:Uncharacterized protein n=1 Tax=Streptomyces daliensis TaxID=299421 RepID=A0A8T4ISW1_9ACTN|nr:hypothetical protein [Streptomyces daliensis]